MPHFGFRDQREMDFPAMVVMEVTNVCNLACVHCPYPFISRQPEYRPRHMNWDLYCRVVDEVSQHPGVLFRLICDGEPMMHPKFLDMLSYAKHKNVAPLNFITNGTLLSEAAARRVLELGVDVVEVSLDALHKSTYEKIRSGSDFDLVMKNVHRLIEMRNIDRYRTKIFVSIIDQQESEGELREFIEYWESRVDKVLTRVYTSIGGMVDVTKLKIDADGRRWPCPLLWQRMFINVDGFAEFCVEDWKDETIVGDVHLKSLQEIWHSSEYHKVRAAHLAEKFKDTGHCHTCKDWKAREWGNDYFSAIEHVFKRG